MEENKIIPMPLYVTRNRVIRLSPEKNGRIAEALFFLALFICSWISIAVGAHDISLYGKQMQSKNYNLACSQNATMHLNSITGEQSCEKSKL
jgi:hypothetical protein